MEKVGRTWFGSRKDRGKRVGQLAGLIALGFLVIGGSSCAPERPASLPVTGIYNRGVSRLEVSRVVVNDPKRRGQVHATYEQIVSQTEAFAKWRNKSIVELARVSQAAELDEESVEAQVEALKQKQRQEFESYIDLQMKLRKLTTKDEFNKLGKFD